MTFGTYRVVWVEETAFEMPYLPENGVFIISHSPKLLLCRLFLQKCVLKRVAGDFSPCMPILDSIAQILSES
jgi:hypothetical protein